MFNNDSYIKRYNAKDYGPEPFVTNIRQAMLHNPYFRSALWTGEHLQLTLMSIPVGGEIGLERHDHTDQFLRLEQGYGQVMMGQTPDRLNYQANVTAGYAIFIPAGTYHNLVNMGNIPIKLYSIYAPPEHARGTVHQTKAIADAAEHH
ncbi:MAG: cupin domain-containing protein [Clostridiales bacterium]|jgi:mannose-6-phosphate isomerase-like protein (cupin superfamily)|nr:cupin domain-containing protein [Clostridiales bacterium]